MQLYLRSLRPVQLRLIAAIALHGKLGLAADACAMTMPAASRMLADMEENLGAGLFTRMPRGMVLTPIGEVLARHARKLASDVDRMAEDFIAHSSGIGGTVRVGAVTGAALTAVIPATLRLKDKAPLVEVALDVSSSSRLMWGLERGEYDFALCRPGSGAHGPDFDISHARQESALFMVRRAHPLAENPNPSLRDLADFPWTMQDQGAPIRRALELAFHEDGVPLPRNLIKTASVVAIMALMRDSDIIAVVTEEVADLLLQPPYAADIALIRPARPVLIEAYHILQPRHRIISAAASELLAMVMEELA
ncbi:LysR family transcriptional regulator [Paracoccus caeni]|uniref:LysR family transcriptional regulator n=2 Tax=Paracoccus caeni TaxID=657651 RepID=A0A934SGP6_9RHOB|nr:LysR family transcriptional regulator [Paracoccus caeni]